MGARRATATVCLLTLAVVCCTPVTDNAEPSYSGYHVLRLRSDTPESLASTLHTLQDNSEVDVWVRLRHSADVMVAPQHLRYVREVSAKHGVDSSVVIGDVHSYLEADFAFRESRRRRRRRSAILDLTNTYLAYEDMEKYLYGTLLFAMTASVHVQSIGKSFEGRNVHVVELRERGSSSVNKPAILIDAGIHAREWISPAMALNIINMLAFNPGNDPEVADLLRKFDWFVVPSINPDGYVYSQQGSTNRLWRKTRTTKFNTAVYGWCRGIGVDGNRNFGFDWNPAVGGSTCPSSDVFAGPAPFSEPETRNIRDWILSHADRAKAYITIHSFGQYLLYPYGSTMNRPLEDEDLVVDVALAFKDKLRERGVDYVVNNSARALYAAAGGSDDYAKGNAKVPVSYTLELPPQDLSTGFLLPEQQIPRVVNDTWAGLKALAQRLYLRLGEPSATTTTTTTSTTTTTTTTPPPTTTTTAAPQAMTLCDGKTDTQKVLELTGRTYLLDPTLTWVRQFLLYYCASLGYPINGR